uniref:Major facilitator superfamily (MFS) profile domain-containing protein n=1 Tax=Corethron hystrix TaxID=216773 RepID=A0A7S1BSZ5_9STRA|mmetsp:Transcript_39979/g.93851  ORF Transcript_39979/g.93851 Transcript_39979/m.93851 type:complete len:543 (+) Transcript_39979:420-2048(+)
MQGPFDAEEEVPLRSGDPAPDYLAANANSLGASGARRSENEGSEGHVQTYTAGEDAGRLAAMAKEMGLSRRRQLRSQVRARPVRTALHRLAFLEDPPPPAGSSCRDLLETVAGVAGNVLEWYDFAVFGYFGDVIGEVFFPPQEGDAATMESFAVFGGAFLARPLGGLLLGYLGDVYGRRRALTTSIFLMAFPTFAMGCLPSYARAGYAATAMLIVIRLLQGMSVGGQLMSSLVFTLENVPRSQWGLYGSFVWATGNFGVLLGGVVGTAVRSSFSHEDLVAYGWRIPFLSGVVVSLAGFYLRWAEEDPSTETNTDPAAEMARLLDGEGDGAPAPAPAATNPLAYLTAPENRRPLLSSAMVPMLWSSGFYLSFVWMAIYMQDLCRRPLDQAFLVNAAALFLGVCLLFPLAGWLSDRHGRRAVMTLGGAGLALFARPLLGVIGSSGDPWTAFGAQLLLGIGLSFWGAPMGAWLAESFPPEARLTSVAVGYNLAHAVVGGATPAVATYLVDAAGPASPGWIYVVVSVVSLTGLWIVAPPPVTKGQP